MITASIRGVQQVQAALGDVSVQAESGGEDGIREALLLIAKEWASRVPVLDGNYQRAMSQENAVKAKMSSKGAVGYVNVPHVKGLKSKEQPKLYAHRLEYGGSDRAPHPSARPALDAVRDQLGGIVGEEVAAGVRSRKGRKR